MAKDGAMLVSDKNDLDIDKKINLLTEFYIMLLFLHVLSMTSYS